MHALPMMRRTMAAIKHLMKHSDEEDISSPMTLVKGKPRTPQKHGKKSKCVYLYDIIHFHCSFKKDNKRQIRQQSLDFQQLGQEFT